MLMDINNLWDTAVEGTVLSAQASDGVDKRPSVDSVNSWNASADTSIDRGNDVAAAESGVHASVNMGHVSQCQKVQQDLKESVEEHVHDVSHEKMPHGKCQVVNVQPHVKSPNVLAVRSESDSKPACVTSLIRDHHVASAEAPELSWQDPGRRCGKDELGATCRDQDRLRKEQVWPDLSGGLHGSGVDTVHCVSIRGKRQSGTPTLSAIREDAPRRGRSRTRTHSAQNQCQDSGQEKSWPINHGKAGGDRGRVRLGANVSPYPEPERNGKPNESHGRSTGTGDQPHPECLSPRSLDSAKSRAVESHHVDDTVPLSAPEQDMLIGDIFAGQVDYVFESGPPHEKSYHQQCQRLVGIIRKELQSVQQIIRRSSKRTHLFEVMCASDSELARQCQNMGKHARRFGLQQADLSTPAGRKNLFAHLIAENPEHYGTPPNADHGVDGQP